MKNELAAYIKAVQILVNIKSFSSMFVLFDEQCLRFLVGKANLSCMHPYATDLLLNVNIIIILFK